jgi:hypothetical protein
MHRHRPAGVHRAQPVSGRGMLAITSIVLILLAGAALAAAATGSGSAEEAARLRSALGEMTKQVQHNVKPVALRLSRNLPGEEDRIGRLREPASTAQAQVKIALNELRQMNTSALDPHYLAAVVAAGRAYVAISGQDPLTGTSVNPEYLGLEPELTADAAHLHGDAAEAAKLSTSVKRLARELIRSRRRAQHLERRVLQLRARSVTTSPQR